MDKQREELKNWFQNFESDYDRQPTRLELWQAAQAAMQPEIDKLEFCMNSFAKQSGEEQEKVMELEQKLSEANATIDQLNQMIGMQHTQLVAHVDTIAQLEEHIRKSQEQKPVAWPVMGHGNVAVGECRNSEDDTAGIIYLLLDKPREIGNDTSDVFPAGGAAPADKTLAAVYFSTPQSIDQTIEVLLEIRKNKFPLYASPIIPPLKGD